MKILALDLSLNSTGYAVFDEDKCLETGVVSVKHCSNSYQKVTAIINKIYEIVQAHKIIWIVREGNSFQSRSRGAFQMYGLNFSIDYRFLEDNRWNYFFKIVNNDVMCGVPPTTIKKFASNKGNAKKEEMLRDVYKKWGFYAQTADEADAYALGKLFYAYLKLKEGKWPPRLTKYEHDSLKKLLEDGKNSDDTESE